MPLNGAPRRYFYNGERVLEELSDSGTMQARYTTENDSYYGQWLHLYRPTGSLSRFPMYDNIGSTRGLLDASGTATDWYELDTFGRQVSNSGTTPNPYRFGAAWGYITDPSGFLQLGQRFYWPEVGRFVSQDAARDRLDWYTYARNEPPRFVDPKGECPPHPDAVACMTRCRERMNRDLALCSIGAAIGEALCTAAFLDCIADTGGVGSIGCYRAWKNCTAAVSAAYGFCLVAVYNAYSDCLDDCLAKYKAK